MQDQNCYERITELEKQFSQNILYRKMREQMETAADERRAAEVEEFKQDLHEIKQYMSSQKSFIGAVIFIVSGMFAVITFFADKIFK